MFGCLFLVHLFKVVMEREETADSLIMLGFC
jgi:hypothetical protein